MNPIAVHLVSLGCPKNLVDSEVYLGRLLQEGFVVAQEPQDADVLMVNTCGFIENAKLESIEAIMGLCDVKADSPRKKVVVTGCLGQRYPDELSGDIPEIDAIVGLAEYGRLPEILRNLVGAPAPGSGGPTPTQVEVTPPQHPAYGEGSRLRLTPAHTAYLRISEGCDNPCTFCAIPSFRGKFRSKPVDAVIAEAEELAASGAVEINLISQDLTSYGVDMGGEYLLPQLLERLQDVPGVRWYRLLYTYPYKFNEAMIEAVADLPKVVPYIDMPIQHIDDRVLKRMGRRMGEAGTRALFDRMRERIDDLVLRTTFIVGFPGEGEAEFSNLLQFVQDARIERVGVFTYSDEEGTPAVRLGEKVSPEDMEWRRERLMLAQQEVAFDWNARRVGTDVELLVDGPGEDPAGETRLVARSYAEAIEIDSHVYLPLGSAEPGQFVRARILRSDGYDLHAEPLAAPVSPAS